MDDIQLINDTPVNNLFTKLCIGALALWGGSIVYRKTFHSSPVEEHARNKRYMINSQTKVNKDIKHLNRNNINIPPPIPNFFGRHKRFNKLR